MVDCGHQDFVLRLPPAEKSVPLLAAVAVREDPIILGIAGAGVGAIDGGADEALPIIGRRIDEVPDDLLPRPSAGPPGNVGKRRWKGKESRAQTV